MLVWGGAMSHLPLEPQVTLDGFQALEVLLPARLGLHDLLPRRAHETAQGTTALFAHSEDGAGGSDARPSGVGTLTARHVECGAGAQAQSNVHLHALHRLRGRRHELLQLILHQATPREQEVAVVAIQRV